MFLELAVCGTFLKNLLFILQSYSIILPVVVSNIFFIMFGSPYEFKILLIFAIQPLFSEIFKFISSLKTRDRLTIPSQEWVVLKYLNVCVSIFVVKGNLRNSANTFMLFVALVTLNICL